MILVQNIDMNILAKSVGRARAPAFLAIGFVVHNWTKLEEIIFDTLCRRMELTQAEGRKLCQQLLTSDSQMKLLEWKIEIQFKNEPEIEYFKSLCSEIRRLSQERNKIVHNPIKFSIDDNENMIVRQRRILSSSKSEFSYSHEKIITIAERINEITNRLLFFEAHLENFRPWPNEWPDPVTFRTAMVN